MEAYFTMLILMSIISSMRLSLLLEKKELLEVTLSLPSLTLWPSRIIPWGIKAQTAVNMAWFITVLYTIRWDMLKAYISAKEIPMMGAYAMEDTGTVSFLLGRFWKQENPPKNSNQASTILSLKFNKMVEFLMVRSSNTPPISMTLECCLSSMERWRSTSEVLSLNSFLSTKSIGRTLGWDPTRMMMEVSLLSIRIKTIISFLSSNSCSGQQKSIRVQRYLTLPAQI